MQSILFDIDNTLFNTGKLIHELIHPALAKKLKVNVDDIAHIHSAYKASLKIFSAFDVWEFLELLAKEFNADVKELENIFFTPDFYPKALFDDTLDTLDFYKAKYDLGIYSEGVEKWQKTKLQLAGLEKYFNKKITLISSDKKSKEVLDQIPKSAYVIDDRLDYLDALKVRKDIYPVWIDRKCSFDKADTHTILELKQLKEVIK